MTGHLREMTSALVTVDEPLVMRFVVLVEPAAQFEKFSACRLNLKALARRGETLHL